MTDVLLLLSDCFQFPSNFSLSPNIMGLFRWYCPVGKLSGAVEGGKTFYMQDGYIKCNTI